MMVRSVTSASALLLLVATITSAKHSDVHQHLEVLHKRHRAEHARSIAENGQNGVELRSISLDTEDLEKRGGQCVFPGSAAGLVPVTPNSQNAGWAMSPDQPCLPGNYCPYACPPGQLSMQWDPSATSYTYPQSMYGGLYCDNSGNVQKPFPNQPYCESGTTTIGVQNNAGSVVSFCQTVLPGNEAMLIPTSVTGFTQLAVPGPNYWAGTAAHYYINPPGVTTDQGCVWGSTANPWGNWAPYVAGANTDSSGNTYMKLGWNPIYLEQATPFRNNMPNWGVSIECDGNGCNGLPCAIDPTKNQVNEMVGSATNGAGGGAFCVVTVPNGVSANFVVTGSTGSSSNSGPPGPPGQPGQGGQFYQSTATMQSASSSAAWTSSAPSTTTTHMTSSYISSSTSSSTTKTSTQPSREATSSTVKNNSTLSGSSLSPSNSPYYSLFNASATYAAPAASKSSEAATAVTASGIAPSILPSKGAASTIEISFASFILISFTSTFFCI